jgi:hypothetical protein
MISSVERETNTKGFTLTVEYLGVLVAYHKPNSNMAHINVLMAFKYKHGYMSLLIPTTGHTQHHAASTVIREVPSQVSAGLPNVLSHVSSGFPQSLYVKAGALISYSAASSR